MERSRRDFFRSAPLDGTLVGAQFPLEENLIYLNGAGEAGLRHVVGEAPAGDRDDGVGGFGGAAVFTPRVQLDEGD